MWGPQARDVLAQATPDDVSDAAIPIRRTAVILVAGAPVQATRISYAGELGWELSADAASAVLVWDALRRVGTEPGVGPFGYRALDSLRMEKGYRYFGTDLTMLESPDQAGLGAFVRPGKGEFIGRAAIIERRQQHPEGPARRLRTLLIGEGPGYRPVFGGEAVNAAGEVIGRLRSVAYGPTIERTIAYALLDANLEEGTPLSVDALGEPIPAVIAADVLVDPRGDRMRG